MNEKQFLFLYPYFEFCRNSIGFNSALENGDLGLLSKIIDTRYRKNGYGINWLLFKDSLDAVGKKLDIAPFIEIKSTDRKIIADITFEDLCMYVPPKYASENLILSQLPKHKRLVLGGFHQNDCVDRFARVSHELGIDTFIDEDTTERFFGGAMLKSVPLERSIWSFETLGIEDKYDLVNEFRRSRPWLTQS